jgi:hypothetical protein
LARVLTERGDRRVFLLTQAFTTKPFRCIIGIKFSQEVSAMLTVQEIERAVSQLSFDELTRFREWFEEFDAKAWDKQFESDAKSGKLDWLANEAIAEYRAGKRKEL